MIVFTELKLLGIIFGNNIIILIWDMMAQLSVFSKVEDGGGIA